MIRAAIIGCAALPGAAIGAPLLGTWCAPEGGTLYVEADSLGMNEHTMCDWDIPPGEAARKVSSVFCREMRHLDGDWIEVNPRVEVISLRSLGADQLRMQFEGHDAVVLERCE